jgi:hypothetical protein
MSNPNRIKELLALASLAFVLLSCGYGIRTEPAVRAVSIGDMDNRTREPKLSDALREALTRELLSRGVRVAGGLDNVISGAIESLEVSPLAERSGTIVKFSVSIRGNFNLQKGPGGETTSLAVPLNYIVAFGSDVSLDSLYAMREEAVRRALADLAADLAATAATVR